MLYKTGTLKGTYHAWFIFLKTLKQDLLAPVSLSNSCLTSQKLQSWCFLIFKLYFVMWNWLSIPQAALSRFTSSTIHHSRKSPSLTSLHTDWNHSGGQRIITGKSTGANGKGEQPVVSDCSGRLKLLYVGGCINFLHAPHFHKKLQAGDKIMKPL